MARIGIIGGTGLGQALEGLCHGESHDVQTPFGRASAPIVTGEMGGVPVALLARHGKGHVYNPSQVPYRANVFALKQLGVTHILASGACGSLREEMAPRHLVVPDQIIDKTFRRPATFFDEAAVHVEMSSPFCPKLRSALMEAGRASSATVHGAGTYVCMEGPQFSTRAESDLHRSWGAHLIGMTLMPEAKLAREAEICYAAIALCTDYDCWKPPAMEAGSVELLQEILSHLREATLQAVKVIVAALPLVKDEPCRCQSALSHAVWTDRGDISAATRERLSPLLSRVFGPHAGHS
jgi:5'-methylthioadenosine phosphorylase